MERDKREKKNWDNCNSIINKIYFFKKRKGFREDSIYVYPALSKQKSCSFWRTLIFQYLVRWILSKAVFI